jgi:hypothetical protein
LLLPLGHPSEFLELLLELLGKDGKLKPPNCALALVAIRQPQMNIPMAALSRRRDMGRMVFITSGSSVQAARPATTVQPTA